MKLVCINQPNKHRRNSQYKTIVVTIGKVYDFHKMSDDSYFLMTDDNNFTWPFHFEDDMNDWVTLDEWREEKLKELGV